MFTEVINEMNSTVRAPSSSMVGSSKPKKIIFFQTTLFQEIIGVMWHTVTHNMELLILFTLNCKPVKLLFLQTRSCQFKNKAVILTSTYYVHVYEKKRKPEKPVQVKFHKNYADHHFGNFKKIKIHVSRKQRIGSWEPRGEEVDQKVLRDEL